MPFTGKFGALNDIRIYQLGCQGILCVNTFAGYHLKPNSSCLWTSDLVLLNEILYTFSSHSQTVHVTKATAWSLHPQRVVCVWERGLGKSMRAQVLNSMRFSWALSYAGTLRKYGSYGIQLPSNHWFRAQLVVSQNLYLPQELILVKGCCCLSIQ